MTSYSVHFLKRFMYLKGRVIRRQKGRERGKRGRKLPSAGHFSSAYNNKAWTRWKPRTRRSTHGSAATQVLGPLSAAFPGSLNRTRPDAGTPVPQCCPLIVVLGCLLISDGEHPLPRPHIPVTHVCLLFWNVCLDLLLPIFIWVIWSICCFLRHLIFLCTLSTQVLSDMCNLKIFYFAEWLLTLLMAFFAMELLSLMKFHVFICAYILEI